MLKGILFFIFQDFPPETETLSKTFKAVVGAVHEDQVWNGLFCLFFCCFLLFFVCLKQTLKKEHYLIRETIKYTYFQ